MRHRIRWAAANCGINKPRAYAICCTCGKLLEAKTRADALTLLHEHRMTDDPRRGVPARMRLVTQLPLRELWNDRGIVSSERVLELDAESVRQHLGEDAVAAIATIGARLEWIEGQGLLEWWRAEAEAPTGRTWQASLWSRGWAERILLFERVA